MIAPAEKTFIPKDRYIEILAKTKDKFKSPEMGKLLVLHLCSDCRI